MHARTTRHGGQTARLVPQPFVAVTAVLLLLLHTPPLPVWAADTTTPVYLLNAVYSSNPYLQNQAAAVWEGMDAALYAANYTAANGRPVILLEPSAAVDPDDIVAVITKALADQPDLLGVIGPFSDTFVLDALASAYLTSQNVVLMAPFTSSSTVRAWNDQVYFARSDPRAELMVIVSYIMQTLRAQRIAYMYLTGVHFGAVEHDSLQETLRSLSHDPAVVYRDEYSTTDGALEEEDFNAMADTRPQVIIVWGMPGLQVEAFLRAVLTDPRTSSAYIMTCAALQEIVSQVYYELVNTSVIAASDTQILSSATCFPPSYTRPLHVQQFHEEMSNYFANPKRSNAASGSDSCAQSVASAGEQRTPATPTTETTCSYTAAAADPNTAMMTMVGWLAGKLIAQTLQRNDWITSRAAYQAGLFEQNRYIVGGDFVLGDYGGPCNEIAISLGATCECNQGGNSAVLTALDNASWKIVENAVFTYPQSVCYSDSVQLKRPLNFLTLLVADFAQLAEIGHHMSNAFSVLTEHVGTASTPSTFNTLNTTLTTVDAQFAAEVTDFSVDIIVGPMLRTMTVTHQLVPAPFFPQPHLVQEQRNYVYLMPTLEQEMFVLYNGLAELTVLTGLTKSDVVVVLRNYPAAEVQEIVTMLDKTSGTFAQPAPRATNVLGTTPLTSAMRAKTLHVVLGLLEGDAEALATFLTMHPAAVVMLTFDDTMIHYDALVAAFSTCETAVQARLLSFSSLPLWTDTSDAAHAASPMLKNFHAVFPDPVHHTPEKFLATITTAVLRDLADTIKTPDAAGLTNAVYRNGLISAGSLTFGPFQWECANTSFGEQCAYKNYGAQNIAVASMQRFLDPSVPLTVRGETPAMRYTPRVHASLLTTAQRNGVIAASVIGGVLLIAAIGLLVYCCADSRDNHNAPKEGREPVTLIFTDIESSTAMWAALPQLMADAIAAHHRVIRQLIKKHGCYEVKTIGDSFMIACSDVYSAVQLACDIQTRLLKYDWDTTEIDSKYREFELAHVDSVEGYEPPTARLSEEVYDSLWRGLRVRIGLHTGLSDIRYDEVTKGYDYYGDTSNMAARTEAIANGGQVVATEITWWALSDEERDATAHTEFGAQGLRGVPFAVEMYQLDAVPGRTHAALRTEIEAILPDDGADETASSAADALLSSVGTMTGAAAGLAFSIASCFAPYPPAQRVRELQPLLAKWSVGAPPRPPQVSEEDYCTALINRLAIRVASVAQARQRMNGAADGSSGCQSMGAARRGSNLLCIAAVPTPNKCHPLLPSTTEAPGRWLDAPRSHAFSTFEQLPDTPSPLHSRSRRSSRATTFSDLVDIMMPLQHRATPLSSLENSGHLFGNRSMADFTGWRSRATSAPRRRGSRAETSAGPSRTVHVLPPLPM